MKQTEVRRLNKFFGGIKEITKLPDVCMSWVSIARNTRLKRPTISISRSSRLSIRTAIPAVSRIRFPAMMIRTLR